MPTNPRFLIQRARAASARRTRWTFFEATALSAQDRARQPRLPAVATSAADVLDALERCACARRAYRCVHTRATETARARTARCAGVRERSQGPIRADRSHSGDRRLLLPADRLDRRRLPAWPGRLGHTVVEPIGSLVPLVERRARLRGQMQGLALKNVTAAAVKTPEGKVVFEDFGELLFTHFGLSGPMVLSASAHMRTGRARRTRSRSTSSLRWTKRRSTNGCCVTLKSTQNRDFYHTRWTICCRGR